MVVVAIGPSDWVAVDVARPKLTTATEARITQWEGMRSRDGAVTLVRGCIATPIPGWVEDMRPAIEGRTIALAGATAEGVVGTPIDARENDGVLVLKRASDLTGPTVGIARTFLGFDEARVATCIVVCASATETTRACDATVKAARLDGATPPPPPGIGLGATMWAVHHPQPTAFALGVLVVGIAVLAILRRRRPRFRAR